MRIMRENATADELASLTVPMLKHYAEDAGEPQAFIDAIDTPELRLAFTATGVMIED